MTNEKFPSNLMTNDIASLALISKFCGECFFMGEADIARLEPLMVHFGFSERQCEAIKELMRACIEIQD